MSHYLYLVSWDADGIVKVGCTSKRRWRMFTNRGARLVHVEEFDRVGECYDVEMAVHWQLRQTSKNAFNERREAARYLGGNGDGWAECYRADPDYALELVKQCSQAMRPADAGGMQPSNASGICTYGRTYLRRTSWLLMDVKLTDPNARAHTAGHDDWSPSKPRYLPTHWRLRLLQGIEQGRRRFAERQAELDAKLAEQETNE